MKCAILFLFFLFYSFFLASSFGKRDLFFALHDHPIWNSLIWYPQSRLALMVLSNKPASLHTPLQAAAP
jgi:hypothetical protein